jgi:hypothetical protein
MSGLPPIATELRTLLEGHGYPPWPFLVTGQAGAAIAGALALLLEMHEV